MKPTRPLVAAAFPKHPTPYETEDVSLHRNLAGTAGVVALRAGKFAAVGTFRPATSAEFADSAIAPECASGLAAETRW